MSSGVIAASGRKGSTSSSAAELEMPLGRAGWCVHVSGRVLLLAVISAALNSLCEHAHYCLSGSVGADEEQSAVIRLLRPQLQRASSGPCAPGGAAGAGSAGSWGPRVSVRTWLRRDGANCFGLLESLDSSVPSE